MNGTNMISIFGREELLRLNDDQKDSQQQEQVLPMVIQQEKDNEAIIQKQKEQIESLQQKETDKRESMVRTNHLQSNIRYNFRGFQTVHSRSLILVKVEVVYIFLCPCLCVDR